MSEEFDMADVFDRGLTPVNAVLRVSSGIESNPSPSACQNDPKAQPAATGGGEFVCKLCSKPPYKTLKGYENHLFLHKVDDYNARKPDLEIAGATVTDFLVVILDEMLKEPNSSSEKLQVIEELKASQEKPDWVWFSGAISDPILHALTQRKKILPSTQYEEFLVQFNKFLNCKEKYTELKDTFSQLISSDLRNGKAAGLVLSRLCIRLPEEIMLFLAQEMTLKKSLVEAMAPDFNEEQFSSYVSSILRQYFAKAVQISSEMWELRSSCLRASFIIAVDDFKANPKEIIKKANWTAKDIVPCKYFVDFCLGVENLIRLRIGNQSCVDLDDVVIALLDPVHTDTLDSWTVLTDGYFSDEDSVLFMRDFVSILIKSSLRKEEEYLRGQEAQRNKLQKVGIRTDLKRN